MNYMMNEKLLAASKLITVMMFHAVQLWVCLIMLMLIDV